MDEKKDDRQIGKFSITPSLMISGALNVALLGTLVFMACSKDKGVSKKFKIENTTLETALHLTNAKQINTYFGYSFDALINELQNDTMVEDGFLKRDLALSCLAVFHHLDMERALFGRVVQTRNYLFSNPKGGEQIPITLYPNLIEEDFKTIIAFSETEKWPLTPEGLFNELKVHFEETSLRETFFHTTEFEVLERIFESSVFTFDRLLLLMMLRETSYKELKSLLTAIIPLPLTEARKRALVFFLKKESKIAAKLLLETEAEFAKKYITNEDLFTLLSLLDPKFKSTETFARKIIESIRPDRVKEKASHVLYSIHNLPLPKEYSHQVVLDQFFKENASTITVDAEAKKIGQKIGKDSLEKFLEKTKQKQAFVRKNEMGSAGGSNETAAANKEQKSGDKEVTSTSVKTAVTGVSVINAKGARNAKSMDSRKNLAAKNNLTSSPLRNDVNISSKTALNGAEKRSQNAGSEQTQSKKVKQVEAKLVQSTNSKKNKTTISSDNTKKTYAVYVVKRGDTLWGISLKYKVKLKDLKALNHISKDHSLKVGRELKIP